MQSGHLSNRGWLCNQDASLMGVGYCNQDASLMGVGYVIRIPLWWGLANAIRTPLMGNGYTIRTPLMGRIMTASIDCRVTSCLATAVKPKSWWRMEGRGYTFNTSSSIRRSQVTPRELATTLSLTNLQSATHSRWLSCDSAALHAKIFAHSTFTD